MAVEDPPKVRLIAAVHGRVQGVGFRYFVAARARARAISGYVRNRTDGGVDVVADGPRPVLEALVEDLRTGPPLAGVRTVDVSWSRSDQTLHEFRVRA